MKKRIWKTAVSLVVTLSLVLGYGNVIALAASTVRGEILDVEVVGRVIMDDMSATASTSYGRGGGYIYATATVYYWFAEYYCKTTVGPNFNTAGGASATATKKLGGADVIGAKGEHKVIWQAYTWEPEDTTIGAIREDSIEL